MAKELSVHALHKRPDLKDNCAELLNSEWSRSKTARLHTLDKSTDDLPYSLVMVEREASGQEQVLGHSRLCKVIGESNAVLVESVVVDKSRRGQGLGRRLMQFTEQHAADTRHEVMYLCTKDKQDFYEHIGYVYCKPVNTMGAQMLETCDCPMPGPDSNLTCQQDCKSSPCQGKQDTSSCAPSSCQATSDSCCSPSQCAPPPPPLPPPLKSIEAPSYTIHWLKKAIKDFS